MDLAHYRQREQAERLAAANARDPQAQAEHLQLAESYRGLVETYERVESLRLANKPAYASEAS